MIPTKDLAGKGEKPGWKAKDLKGLLSADIDDYDGDGAQEMLVISFSAKKGAYSQTAVTLTLRMFEYNAKKDTGRQAAKKSTVADMMLLGDTLYRPEQINVFTYTRGEERLIAVDLWESMNDTVTVLRVCRYTGKKFAFDAGFSYEQYGVGDLVLRKALKDPEPGKDETVWTALYDTEKWEPFYTWSVDEQGGAMISQDELKRFRAAYDKQLAAAGLSAGEEKRSGFFTSWITDGGTGETQSDVNAEDLYAAADGTFTPLAGIVLYRDPGNAAQPFLLHRYDGPGLLDAWR